MEAYELLIQFRDHVERAIDRALATGDLPSWEDVGVLVIDTTSAEGQRLAERSGEFVEWSDDGKIATFTTSADVIRDALDNDGYELDVNDQTGGPYALVAGISAQGEVVVVKLARSERRSKLLFGALQATVDEAIERSLELKPDRKWNDIGVVIAELRYDLGRKLTAAWAGEEHASRPDGLAIFAVDKDTVRDILMTLTVSKKLPSHENTALVACFAAADDILVVAHPSPEARPITMAELARNIDDMIAKGYAKSWDEVGAWLLDPTTEIAREMFGIANPGKENAGVPIVLLVKKAEIISILKAGGGKIMKGDGALLVRVGADNVFRPTYFKDPKHQ